MIKNIIGFLYLLTFLSSSAMADDASAKKESDAFSHKWVSLFNKQDAVGLGAMYTEDAITGGPGGFQVGKDAIQEEWSNEFKAGARNMVLTFNSVHEEGGMIFSTGVFTFQIADKPIKGYFASVHVHQGNTLLLKQNMGSPAQQ